MLEHSMYFGIGFLSAGLFALLFVAPVHNRAVRLTTRRLEAAMPGSIAELHADKDQLRAAFAMSTRRLEMKIEQTTARAAGLLAEVGRKTDAISRLNKDLDDKTSTISELEARENMLRDRLRAAEEEFEVKSSALRESERLLADKEAELAQLAAELGEQSMTADGQRVELAALRTQVEALKVGVADRERAAKDAEERLTRQRGEADAAAKDLSDAREKLESLGTRTAELERQLVAQTTKAEFLTKHVEELETRLGDQGRLLAQRADEIERLRGDNEAWRKIESDLRSRSARGRSRNGSAVKKSRSAVAQVEAQPAAALDARAILANDIGAMKRENRSAAGRKKRPRHNSSKTRANSTAPDARSTAIGDQAGISKHCDMTTA